MTDIAHNFVLIEDVQRPNVISPPGEKAPRLGIKVSTADGQTLQLALSAKAAEQLHAFMSQPLPGMLDAPSQG